MDSPGSVIVLGPSLVVNILQTPTLGAAGACDEPGNEGEFATGFAVLDGSCWANLRSGDLLAWRSWPSSFLPYTSNGSVVNPWNVVV